MLDKLPSFTCQPITASEKRLRGSRAEANDYRRFQNPHLCFEPRIARPDFGRVRFFVYSPFAAFLKLEMLDRIGDVDAKSIEPRFRERLVENLARWSQKWTSLTVLLITRLFADTRNTRCWRAFAENRLNRGTVEIAAATPLGRFLESR